MLGQCQRMHTHATIVGGGGACVRVSKLVNTLGLVSLLYSPQSTPRRCQQLEPLKRVRPHRKLIVYSGDLRARTHTHKHTHTHTHTHTQTKRSQAQNRPSRTQCDHDIHRRTAWPPRTTASYLANNASTCARDAAAAIVSAAASASSAARRGSSVVKSTPAPRQVSTTTDERADREAANWRRVPDIRGNVESATQQTRGVQTNKQEIETLQSPAASAPTVEEAGRKPTSVGRGCK